MAPRDRNHAACAKLLRTTRELLLPAPVLVELDYFLTELTGSHRPFDEVLRRIENGVFTILDLEADDYPRVRELCAQHGDWPLGFVDAAVVALAERERQTRIATDQARSWCGGSACGLARALRSIAESQVWWAMLGPGSPAIIRGG